GEAEGPDRPASSWCARSSVVPISAVRTSSSTGSERTRPSCASTIPTDALLHQRGGAAARVRRRPLGRLHRAALRVRRAHRRRPLRFAEGERAVRDDIALFIGRAGAYRVAEYVFKLP